MKISVLITAAALALQASVSLAQQPPAPDLGLREISSADLDRYVAKSNGVVGLLNASLRGKDSWNRYLSWVDLKRGPTGKERIIYGPVSYTHLDVYKRQISDCARSPVPISIVMWRNPTAWSGC